MIGLEQIVAGHLMLASTQQPACTYPPNPPVINVIAKGTDLVLDTSKSIAELTTFKPLTGPSPYADDSQTYIQGLARGKVGVSARYQFATQTFTSLGQECMFVSQVDIYLNIDPTIYIAREYPKGTCYYNAVLEHELKHFRTDRALINKYTTILVKAANNTLKTIGFLHGPYAVAQRGQVQGQITQTMDMIIGKYGENFSAERDQAQSHVDTMTEYDRVHALCKNWPQPKL